MMKQLQSRALLVIPFMVLSLSSCVQRTVLHNLGSEQGEKKTVSGAICRPEDLGADGTDVARPTSDNVRIWFVREEAGELHPAPVERTLSASNLIEAATDQLLRGPTAEERKAGIQSEIPTGTVLIGVNDKGPVKELNLSQRFTSGGESSMEARLSQLQRTIKEVAGQSKVFLDVEGHRLLTAGEGLEVKQPLNE